LWRGVFDFREGEDFVFAAGGEGADGFTGGVGGAFFVAVFLLGVAGAFEEMGRLAPQELRVKSQW